MFYVPGLSVDRARDTYRALSPKPMLAMPTSLPTPGAHEARPRRALQAGEQEIAELQLLLARRRDLITDQSRTITRLREMLLSLFPALERALDLNSKGPLTLLTHYQTPAQLRGAGHKRVGTYPRETVASKGQTK